MTAIDYKPLADNGTRIFADGECAGQAVRPSPRAKCWRSVLPEGLKGFVNPKTKYASSVTAECDTRAHCANPAHGAGPFTPLRPGHPRQRHPGVPRPAAARGRGSALPAVACAPAPPAHHGGPCLPAPVAPLRARARENRHFGAHRPGRFNSSSGSYIMTIDIDTQSVTSTICDNGRPLRRHSRTRRVRSPRGLGPGRRPCRHGRSLPHPLYRRHPRRHPARR